MSRRQRRALALVFSAWVVGLGAATLVAASVPASAAHCKHRICDPSPKPTPADEPTPPDERSDPPKASPVQAAALPSSTPYDNTRATPGPVVGTVITPSSVLEVPAAAPTIQAHPQGETGLTALIIAGIALGALTLLSVTASLALR
jgi:hypothetical protein